MRNRSLAKEFFEEYLDLKGRAHGFYLASETIREAIETEDSENSILWEGVVEPSDATMSELPEDVRLYIKALELIAPDIEGKRNVP